jgi:hypothetical protein
LLRASGPDLPVEFARKRALSDKVHRWNRWRRVDLPWIGALTRILEISSKTPCAAQRVLALWTGKQELAVSQSYRHTPIRRTARAVAATRPVVTPVTLTTLILTVLLGLLSGAAWMQLT